MIVTNKYNRQYDVPDDDRFWQKTLREGIYQVQNLRFVNSLKKNLRTVVDIGANMGQNTVEYSCIADRVVSFEPTPNLFLYLQTNVNLNQTNIDTFRWDDAVSMKPKANVTLYNIALGDKPDIAYMRTYQHNCGRNFISPDSTEGTEIQVATLDSYNLDEVDFIKIDVEGYEHKVLLGALDTIKRNKPIIQTEIIEEHLQRQGSSFSNLSVMLSSMGYTPILRTGKVGNLENLKKSRITDIFWVQKNTFIEF
jgi:FkbM family methyltransferase